ncbi:BnaCnng64570D [Brassica napus]|uniref:BnaCnng64570D protein n=1 Tax=Brassica napus TaxID=3708 RepID=A0A078JVR7_BRANA|nr:BnaCnng64570D [Brassica napus]
MWYLSFLLLRHINLEFCLKYVVGHMKLVNGQSIIETPILDEVEIARARHVLVHVQSHDGPVMKLYLWDQAARDLCKKFKSYENTSTVLLVTTVNTKSLGGILTLTSCPPHMFLWTTTSNLRSTGWALIHRQGSTKVQLGFFECTATIDDVVHGSTWYYISCSGCHTKATKDPTSLMCSKCGKVNIAGVAQYRAQISVYDNSEQVVFVLLGDAGYELTGKHALELVSSYFEVTFIIQYPQMLRTEVVELDCQANGNQGVTQEVHVPEALISTIGQKHNFCVKVTKHNLEGKSRSLTVTKILPLDTPAAT